MNMKLEKKCNTEHKHLKFKKSGAYSVYIV